MQIYERNVIYNLRKHVSCIVSESEWRKRKYIICFNIVQALDLLTPPLPQNAASQAKVHVRRGTAYSNLQLYAEGNYFS